MHKQQNQAAKNGRLLQTTDRLSMV